MGDDEAGPSSAVKITASDDTVEAEELDREEVQEAEELEEPEEEADGWAAEAEAMVEEEAPGTPEKEEEGAAEVMEGETDAGPKEPAEEPEEEKEKKEEEGDEEEQVEDEKEEETGTTKEAAKGRESEDDGAIGVATLVVGAARTEEELEQEAETASDIEPEGQDLTPDTDEYDDYPGMEEDLALTSERMPLPAFLTTDKGDLDRRKVFALGAVVLLLLVSSLIYLVLNRPLVIAIADERLGDEVRYEVSGSLWFDYDGKIEIPGVNLSISGADLLYSGELKMGTKKVEGTVVDGYHYGHTTFQRYTRQDLDEIDGELLYVDGGWDELPGRFTSTTASRDYIDETSFASIKTVTQNNLTYTVAAKDKGLSQEAITYVQTAPADIIEMYRQLVTEGRLTEGDGATTTTGSIQWSVEKGGRVLGHETLVIVIHRKYTEKDLQVPFISGFFQFSLEMTFKLWMSEASAYPLKLQAMVDIDKPRIPDLVSYSGNDLPAWVYPRLEAKLAYTATASSIEQGTTVIERQEPFIGTGLKHRLAQEQGQFKAWTEDGAPQLGEYDLLKTGFDDSFDLQKAISVAKNDTLTNDLDDYLEDNKNRKPFVVEARYNGTSEAGVPTSHTWNFTMGFHDDAKSLTDTVKGHHDLVNRTLSGSFPVSGEKVDLRNPTLSRDSLKRPLTLRGMELVLGSNEHTSRWVFDNGRFDYTRANLSLTEILGTPGFDYSKLITAYRAGNLNEVIDELVNEQRSYGYIFEKGAADSFQRARVDGENGELTYIITQSTYSEL